MIRYRVCMIREFDANLSVGIGPVYMILTKTGQSLDFAVGVLRGWLRREFTYISYSVKGHGLVPIRKYPHLRLLNVSTEKVPGWRDHSTYVVKVGESHNATLVKEDPEYLLYEVVQDPS